MWRWQFQRILCAVVLLFICCVFLSTTGGVQNIPNILTDKKLVSSRDFSNLFVDPEFFGTMPRKVLATSKNFRNERSTVVEKNSKYETYERKTSESVTNNKNINDITSKYDEKTELVPSDQLQRRFGIFHTNEDKDDKFWGTHPLSWPVESLELTTYQRNRGIRWITYFHDQAFAVVLQKHEGLMLNCTMLEVM